MKNSLIIFTDAYPYGKDDLFIEAELGTLCAQHDKVVLVPRHRDGALQPLPANCEVLNIEVKFNAQHKIRKYLIKWFFPVMRSLLYMMAVTKNRAYYRKNMRAAVMDLMMAFEEGEMYLEHLKPYLKNTKVLYFFWFQPPFLQLALQKQLGKLNQRMVSRGLGYDYDPIQNKLGLFRYRELEMKSLDNLVINSRWGAELVQKLYPRFASKVSYSYLGIPYTSTVNPEPTGDVFHLVSCAYVIDLKRVHLIVEILKHINFPIKWTHLGKGPLLDDIRQQAATLPAHVTTELPGFVPSVIDVYRTQPIDLFITTTWTEGLPYSLVEAIAHGIPVMGTAVCGIPEIITKQTGFLIPQEFDPAEAAAIITNYRSKPAAEKHALRQSAKAFFESTFTSEKNIEVFVAKYLN